ncbi:MAG TPA: cation:proton antiporter [Syntrophales bacterium]|nr:cation:proton antiporter [Syntrophales bacterium]HOL59487.1 cation:proton antiporter [Syntrophales bacterium]HPO34669.1 cation:proton antiporter [Syntrophales bacterium]
MDLLSEVIIIMGLSVAVIYLCQKAKLPVIVGFLLTGMILGPGGLKLIKDPQTVKSLAEIGVVLLLFTVGLELSVVDLLRMRKVVFICGSLQVGITILFFALLAYLGRVGGGEAVIVGFLMSLSSTAVVMKIFQDRAELETPHGNTTLGILIFQDVAVVPMMLAIPLLAGLGEVNLSAVFVFLSKIALVIGAIFALSQWVVPKLLFQVARARSRELFLITILVLCLSVAWITNEIGLSLALGAFIAGMIISDSEYSHQALGNILPFRDVFTSFFFVSIGMLFNLQLLFEKPFFLLGSTCTVVVLKVVIAAIVVLAFGHAIRTAVLVGLALGQVGEFSFVLASASRHMGILKDHVHQLFLGVSVLTMAFTPFMIERASSVADLVLKLPFPKRIKRGVYPVHRVKRKEMRDHLIIVGYGFNGRNLARAARTAHIPYVVIEMNPTVVKEERKQGEEIYYGDATQEAILLHAGVNTARAVAVVINDPAAARRITHTVRRLNDKAYLLVRTKYLTEIKPLKSLGADDVIPEEFETSVAIFSRILEKYLLPREEIERLVSDIRSDSYRLLRRYTPEPKSMDTLRFYLPNVEITSFRVEKDSPLIGRTLLETEMRKKYGVTLLAVRRGMEVLSNPSTEIKFYADDVLFVVGSKTKIEEVKRLFNPFKSKEQ